MSTNATITVKCSDDTYSTIYTHWDGYPSHHMVILEGYYASQELAEKLVSLGDMSCLENSIDECIYYDRNRQEDWEDVQPRKTTSLKDVCMSAEYNYYWNGDRWQVGRY